MTCVIQRVTSASVSVDGIEVGACGQGLVLLLGVSETDTKMDAEVLAKKIAALRIFSDEEGRMNLSVLDIDGEALVIPNFTLMASYKKGNRPDFMQAAPPMVARSLYEYFVSLLREQVRHVGTGEFGAHMKIDICADGPVTIVRESEKMIKKQGGADA